MPSCRHGRAHPSKAAPRPARQPVRAPAGPAPTRARLHETAVAHLARFSVTEAGLVRVLDRRIDRWVRAATNEAGDPDAIATARAAAQAAARAVAQALVRSGVVDDAAFAGARARGLTRAGRSRRAVGAHLAARGVAPDLAQAALPDPADELATALAFARRRRIGPFRARPPTPTRCARSWAPWPAPAFRSRSRDRRSP